MNNNKTQRHIPNKIIITILINMNNKIKNILK